MRSPHLIITLVGALAATHASAFTVTMRAAAEGGAKPIVTGTTNLPDGAELLVDLNRKESRYSAQAKTIVKNGAFVAGPFSRRGNNLNPGSYKVTVTMAIAGVQPSDIRPVLGYNGENLQGPLAKDSSFGGRVVEYNTSIKIGGAKSAAKDRALSTLSKTAAQ